MDNQDQLSEDVLRRLLDAVGVEDFSPHKPAAAPELVGPFDLLEPIGEGASALVFRARLSGSDTICALKVLRPALAAEAAPSRFYREALILRHLNHPGIARFIATGPCLFRHHPTLYIAMEWVDGVDPVTFAEQRHLDVAGTVQLVIPLIEAVQFAHNQGIIHRDLKPSNIRVNASGVAKILDFGLAFINSPNAALSDIVTEHGRPIGTPAYMSPERFTADGAFADVRQDVWALGAILYRLFSGHPPQIGSPGSSGVQSSGDGMAIVPLSRLRADVPGDLSAVIEKALSPAVAERYQSARELLDDLASWCRGDPVSVRPPSLLRRFGRWIQNHRAVSALGLLFIATTLTLMGLWITTKTRESTRLEESILTANRLVSLASDAEFTLLPYSFRRDFAQFAFEVVQRVEHQIDRPRDQSLLRADIYEVITDLHRLEGPVEESLKMAQQVFELRRSVQSGEDPEWKDFRAIHRAQIKVGNLLNHLRRFAATREVYETAHAELEQVLRQDPKHSGLNIDFFNSLERLAQFEFDQQNYPLAKKRFRDVFACGETILQNDPTDQKLLNIAIRAGFAKFDHVLEGNYTSHDAAVLADQLVEWTNLYLQVTGGLRPARFFVVQAQVRRSLVAAARQDPARVLSALNAALSVNAQVLTTDPRDSVAKQNIPWILDAGSKHLRDAGDLMRAAEWTDRALEELRMAAQPGRAIDQRIALIHALARAAFWARDDGNHSRAEVLAAELIPLAESFLKTYAFDVYVAMALENVQNDAIAGTFRVHTANRPLKF